MNLKKLIYPDLLNGSIGKSLLCFTLPLFVSYLFQQLYNAADTVIVGHYLCEESLAAIGACAAIFELMIGFGNGIGTGLSIVAARTFGSGDMKKLKRVVAASLLIIIAVSIAITFCSVLFLRPALILMGTPQAILDEAVSYISKIGIFCIVLIAYNFCAGMLRAIGNSFMPLIFLVISSVLNIFLDILLISKFGMGIEGTAIATVIAQGISVVLCVIYIFARSKILIPEWESFGIRGVNAGALYKELAAQGISMALMGTIISSGTAILQSAINGFGTMIMAGHIAVRKIFTLSSVILFTLGMASSTFVSQNYGAKKIERVKKGVKTAILSFYAYTVVLICVSPFIVKPLIEFISGSKNPEIIGYGTKYLYFAFPFYFALGPLVVLRNTLQGLGAKILPLISSIMELIGKILFTTFIIPLLGTWGIILCEPLIWCVMAIELIIAYFIRIREIEKNI